MYCCKVDRLPKPNFQDLLYTQILNVLYLIKKIIQK